MTKIERYTQEAIAIANDNSHGYSQASRWGTPDYDCSSMVITVVENSGIPVKTMGATYTGNMRSVFLSCGFKDVTASCNLANASGMVRGDILLNDVNHTAIYIGENQLVHARSSEGNSTPGDQSGNEIRTQPYWNYPWNVILRYGATNEEADGVITAAADINGNNKNYPEVIKIGDCGEEVKTMQNMLIAIGYSCGSAGADGEFGNGTLAALTMYQTQKGLEADGEYGPLTRASLESNYKAFTGKEVSTDGNTDVISDEETIWFYLVEHLGNKYGSAGLMGNLFAESGLKSNNLENSKENGLGYTDDEYVKAVDNGSYGNFVYDNAGFGLAQWTFYSRKANLLKFIKERNVSIADLESQLDFLMKELESDFNDVFKTLKSATSVLQASNIVLIKFENPADKSLEVQGKRASYGNEYYAKYSNMEKKSEESQNNPELILNTDFDARIGEVVSFVGDTVHTLSNGGQEKKCKSGDVRITNVATWAKYPYHIVGTLFGKSNAYGWVSSDVLKVKE